MKDFVIIANGPFLYRDIILEAIQNKTVVVLDGALNKLRWLESKYVDYILGDFDSVDSTAQEYWGITQTCHDITDASVPYPGMYNTWIVPAKNQDRTDLEKAINYCDKHEASSITILCASGGRADHHEAVMRAMKHAYQPQRVITLQTEQQSLRYARDEVVSFEGCVGDHCGFASTTASGHGTSEGLLYPCDKHHESFCNQLVSNAASLTVHGEALLFLPPQLTSQRKFMLKSELERLQLLCKDAESNEDHRSAMRFFCSFS
jgi:thiamine pyrophosphokinase